MQSFVKIKSSRNGEITLSLTDIEKSCPSREYLAWQKCLFTLFVKIKFAKISGFTVNPGSAGQGIKVRIALTAELLDIASKIYFCSLIYLIVHL